MKHRVVKVLSAIWLLVLSQTLCADTLGVYLGAGAWKQAFNGNIFNMALEAQDAETLGLEGNRASFFYAKLEHPVPVLPNVRLAKAEVSDIASFNYVTPLFLGAQIDTEIDLSHTDVTLYWELLDTALELDFGLTGRKFDGGITQSYLVEDAPGSGNYVFLFEESQPIAGTIPMLYLSVNFNLPVTGIYLGAEVNSLSYRGDGFTDMTTRIGWKTDSWIIPEIGFEAGYRKLSLKIDSTNSLDASLDLGIDGFFLSVVAHL